jgi:uncharacterized protein YkwD
MTRRRVLVALATTLATLAAPVASTSAAGLAAPATTCPGQSQLDAPAAAQIQTMLCMTNFARAKLGQPPLEEDVALATSATEKAADILSCDSFSHFACGREFSYWIRASGYMSSQCWHIGENLAWGAGPLGTVGSIFRAWMRSPEHRANLLGNYTQIGIDVETGTLEGHRGARVWTQHFGSHCE